MAVPQQPISIAANLDSQTLVATVSGNIQKHSIKKKKVLNTEENDLFELTQAAGIAMDQEVFKVVLDLLKMNVAPLAVFQMLKAMCAGQRVSDASSAESLPNAHQSGLPESRVRFPAKTSKIPAPLSFSSVLRPTRLAIKNVVCSPADASSPLSQGPPGSFQFSCCLFSPFTVRSKSSCVPAGGQAPAERSSSSRDSSGQRVPRQPSASRLQKSAKCTGVNSSAPQLAPS
ncbi:mitotic-spindle organizing protein 2 isoform X1 [Erpetoichthys calabaricus]|uniref:Mitotic spindle organizing protein 2B n=1 Tax=Erpetoichthys calabaricus TaxID=27687 RepID=A0A8C4TD83_ERPCA|nr:mitotic-spindle organizing protein 2 isoform X1 [Erpetoichthys calabaricus]XP_051777106.1 mitotic-spindle organizing protein 2 isoform X1 [Erpetoichthys calabaricus]